ncbi:MAG: ferric reductase-like transmembrane domain-containing protein, partial [Thermoplasmata archaeon]|nr:ferric reductase-like transmembrane domain-containing protein [Thermoplasmata archaeon]
MSLNAVEIAIIMALIITAVMCLAHKYVNRYRWVVYLITLLVGAYFVLPNVLGYEIGWLSGRSPFKQAFTLGALSCMLFAVVAYVGVLPDKWKLKKRLKGIRAELSVMACILAFCHTMYFSYYFITFFTDPGSLNGYYIYACAASLVLDCLMVPLMITSFYSVRKYFKASTWKRLQQCSYIFYVALLVHVWG